MFHWKSLVEIVNILATSFAVGALVGRLLFGQWFGRVTREQLGPPDPRGVRVSETVYLVSLLVMVLTDVILHGKSAWWLLFALMLGRAIRETTLWWKGRGNEQHG